MTRCDTMWGATFHDGLHWCALDADHGGDHTCACGASAHPTAPAPAERHE